jgi:hypothetical protein
MQSRLVSKAVEPREDVLVAIDFQGEAYVSIQFLAGRLRALIPELTPNRRQDWIVVSGEQPSQRPIRLTKEIRDRALESPIYKASFKDKLRQVCEDVSDDINGEHQEQTVDDGDLLAEHLRETEGCLAGSGKQEAGRKVHKDRRVKSAGYPSLRLLTFGY